MSDIRLRALLLSTEFRRRASLKTDSLTGHEGVFIPMDLWHPLRDLLRDVQNLEEVPDAIRMLQRVAASTTESTSAEVKPS